MVTNLSYAKKLDSKRESLLKISTNLAALSALSIHGDTSVRKENAIVQLIRAAQIVSSRTKYEGDIDDIIEEFEIQYWGKPQ